MLRAPVAAVAVFDATHVGACTAVNGFASAAFNSTCSVNPRTVNAGLVVGARIA